MSRVLVQALEGAGLAVLGALSAGAVVLGATGGIVSQAVAIVSKGAESTVVVAVIGLTAAGLSATATIGVALIKRSGDERGATIDRIEATTTRLASTIEAHHLEMLHSIAEQGERIALLEALKPAADERAQRIARLEQDVARLQGHLRRD